MSDKYIEIIEEIELWWRTYKEVLIPDEIIKVDPEEMILRWADYNEKDIGNFDLGILVEMSEELEVFM